MVPEGNDFYVVGIGCSAGGPAAYNELFSKLPSDINAAFIVIQHLHPEFKSFNYELVAQYTSMKVLSAVDGELVAPGCVYFLPENAMMTIKDGRLHLRTRRKDEIINHAVDIFFNSLGIDAKEKAIGVILSGYGKDGSAGVEEIHERGGIVICQAPRTALHKGMPQSLINRISPDFILPLDELALKLLELTKYTLKT